MKKLVALAWACIGVTSVQAAVWTIHPTSHCPVKDGNEVGEVEMTGPQQLTNAFTQLQGGDTVLVKPGTYDLTGLYMGSRTWDNGGSWTVKYHLGVTKSTAFTLKGETDGHWDDAVVFKGDGRCLDANGGNATDQVVCGITFDGFSGGYGTKSGSQHTGRGGAILFDDGRSANFREYATNCVFRNCKSYSAGAVDLGMVVDCCISNCTSKGGAGGATSNCRIRGCYIKNCSSDSGEGASNSFGVWDTVFEGNSGVNGGALSVGVDFPVSNCIFRANTSTSNGGAIYSKNSALKQAIVDCVFEDNSSKNGGAVLCSDDTVNWLGLVGCVFSRNRATEMGGAVYCTKKGGARDCIFSNNVANTGGAYAAKTSDSLVGCLFVGNTNLASNGGGAYFPAGAAGLVSNCTFVANVATNTASASGRGGGLYVEPGDVPVVDCVFSNNFAYYGGAYAGNAAVSRCAFVSNGVIGVGGAIFSMKGRLDDSTFVGNRATDASLDNTGLCRGGAILVSNTGYKYPIEGCTFSNNLAFAGGAVADGAVSNCLFFGNSLVARPAASKWNNVNSLGGAVLFVSTNGWVRNSTFVSNAVPLECGAGSYGGAVASSSASGFVTDCVFSNNFSYIYGGALSRVSATNCAFVGNCARMRGAALHGGAAVGCTFVGQTRTWFNGKSWEHHSEYGGTDAYEARLENCDCGGGCFWKCSLLNCTIHDVKDICVFYEENFATNCLVSGCAPTQGMFYRYLYSPEFSNHDYRGSVTGRIVNCTFADNALPSGGMITKPNGGNYPTKDPDGKYPPIPDDELRQPLAFANCIFYGNRRGTVPADISGGATSGPTYSNCLYGACDDTLVLGGRPGWTDLGGNLPGADPRFVADKAEAKSAPRYSLRCGSPARGKGDVAAIVGIDTDLAGKDRLRDGKLDLGCYQCWLDPIGMCLFIR